MKTKVLGVLILLFAILSCIKEEALEQPVDGGEERFAEFDPVVRFGLDTYMGDLETKTEYAGDDKTVVVLDKATATKVRYERINWNALDPADPRVPNYLTGLGFQYLQDVVQIQSEEDFTHGNKKSVSYFVTEAKGRSNVTEGRYDYADAAPFSGADDDVFYWSREGTTATSDRYFYAVYPNYEYLSGRYSLLTKFDLDKATHTVTVAGSINKRNAVDLEESRRQHIVRVEDRTIGTYKSREYYPDMSNAFMYAAVKVPGADAGYKKVDLRFKPLYSAIKLIVSGRDAGAKAYRLKRVDLRTDMHNNGTAEYRTDLNPDDKGTPLGGAFETTYTVGADGYTGDFTPIAPTAVTDTLKRLFIEIPQDERMVLGNDTVKVTFLVTPVKHQYLVVDYTFEFMKDPAKGWTDPDNVVEEHRYLALQQPGTKGSGVFGDGGWFELPAANKLYVRSNVPRIQYYFSVEAQSFFPRTYNNNDEGGKLPVRVPVPGGDNHWLAPDFYSVVSYRDSAGIKQPLKWKVIGYGTGGYNGPFSPTKPPELAWLKLRGEDGTWNPAHNDNKTDPYNPASGVNAAGDPWSEPWGYGTHMEGQDGGPGRVIKDGNLIGYTEFKKRGSEDGSSYVFFDAGSQELGAQKWIWKLPASYTYRDQDGSYYYPTYAEDGSLHPKSEESYAYDLSSHDIYGNLMVAKNGDLGSTANSYVVTAAGWYRIPTVYGNAIKNGKDNPGAYTGKASASPETLLAQFRDHDDKPIAQPWINKAYSISKGTDGAELVWEDATDLLGAKKYADTKDARRGNQQKPFFWEDPKTGYGYIYFYVNQLASGNALLKAKSNGTTVWSWHIWCVPDVVDPDNGMLAQVAIEPTELNYYEQTGGAKEYPFQSVHKDQRFFQKMDLGQSYTETAVESRAPVYVQFAQYWKGEIIDTVVVCFAQSGVNDNVGITQTPAFQWGRKDPLMPALMKKSSATASGNSLGNSIRNPDTFLYGNNKSAYHGGYYGAWVLNPRPTRYDNLWNSNVDYNPETFNYHYGARFVIDSDKITWYCSPNLSTNPREGYQSGDYRFEKDDTQTKGRRDTPVRKTVYDPCPPGFVVPNLYAFTAFNNRGLMETKADAKNLAANWKWDTPLNSREDDTFADYYDFYTGYDENAGAVTSDQDVLRNLTERLLQKYRWYPSSSDKQKQLDYTMTLLGQNGHYRRDPNSKTIRFYALGRIHGLNAVYSSNVYTYDNNGKLTASPEGMYWMAEPATAQDVTIGDPASGPSDTRDNTGDWSFGSSFYFQRADQSSGRASIYPVAGGTFAAWMQYIGYLEHGIGWSTYEENQSAFWARNKWQRTHALHIRPMEEPPVSP